LVVAACGAAIALSGCVVFISTPTGEKVSRKAVRVAFSICVSGQEDGSCPDQGNSGSTADDGRENQLLLAFRVPKGSKLPDRIEPTTAPVEGELTPDGSYRRRLTQEAPTPDGFKWAAYRSEVVTADQEDVASFSVRIRLPDGFRGRKFKVRPVVGYFQPNDEVPAGSPIVCGDALYARDDDDNGDRVCIDSPDVPTVGTHIKIPVG
jgi:hypothetical protein